MESALSPTSPTAPRPRKKLQKGGAKKRNSIFKRSGTSLSFNSPTEERHDGVNTGPFQAKPCLPLPPDLSDSKWSDFLRRSARPSSQVSSPLPTPTFEAPRIIPELSHLAISDAKPPPSPASSSVDSPVSATRRFRRQAKTPVRSIGQLERARPPPLPKTFVDERPSSVELLAQQYRDLLYSRTSLLTDARPVRAYSCEDDEIPAGHGASPLNTLPGSSPASDDGTLVSFQGETVYFKPYSFSPGVWSSTRSLRKPTSSGHLVPDNLSFQLCLELLTRELSTAVGNRSQRTGSNTAALQILMMIEAYERLRGQLAEARRPPDEARQLEAMLDVWLRSLYAVHDSLMGESRSRTSESDYDAFDMEGLE